MSESAGLAGRRILITGAARGIGAALVRRLTLRGARVALAGLEPEVMAEVAASCGDAPWRECNVSVRASVVAAVEDLSAELGGLDVVVANAGIGAQMPMVGGDPAIMEQTIGVNLMGVYYTLAAAGPHISHPGGYALLMSSAAAGLHLPLMGAYCASKAGVEALGDCLRIEIAISGARVGVGYFGEIETDMTRLGMRTEAASHLDMSSSFTKTIPLSTAIDAIERGIAGRKRRVCAPRWVGGVMPIRTIAQRFIDARFRNGERTGLRAALDIARRENAPLTTAQPEV